MHYILIRQVSPLILLVYGVRVSFLVKKNKPNTFFAGHAYL